MELSWEREGSSRIYAGAPTAYKDDEHGVKSRLFFVKDIFHTLENEGFVIDIGCGPGVYTNAIHRLFANTLGIEIERMFLETCKGDGFYVTQAIAENIPVRTKSCQLALLFEVIEHVKSEASVLKEVHRILSPNGYLFVTAPNRFYPFETHGFQIHGRTIQNLLGIGIPLLSFAPSALRKRIERARIYSQKDLVRLLHSHGFRVIRIGYLPPPLDRPRQTPIISAVRRLFAILSTKSPFKQMGVSCMILAQKN